MSSHPPPPPPPPLDGLGGPSHTPPQQQQQHAYPDALPEQYHQEHEVPQYPGEVEGDIPLPPGDYPADPGQAPLQPPGQTVTIQDALSNVSALTSLPLTPGDIPRIQAPAQNFFHDANFNTGFADRCGFTTGVGKYVEEAARQAELSALLEEGDQYTALLYTWRGCSQAILSIQSKQDDRKREVYAKTIEILEPEIEKLRQFMDFQRRASHALISEVKRLCADKSEFASEAYLHTLGKFINMFATLDELKNNKANIKNDYATYKRASEILKRFNDQSSLEMSQRLSMFLANHNVMLTNLKKTIQEIPGFEELLSDVINTCVYMYENKQYLLPNEKHGIVKVVGFSLFLMDTKDKVNINKLDGKRKVSLSRVDKMFKKMEVVPLYGDMMVAPFNYIKNTPNYDPEKWPHCTSEKNNAQGQILKVVKELREQHLLLVTQLTLKGKHKRFMEEHSKQDPKATDGNQNVVEEDRDEDLYQLAEHTLSRLAHWTTTLTELFSWKLLHPVDPKWDTDKECPQDAEEYERKGDPALATRYNYTKAEKTAITEVLGMIKGVQEMVLDLAPQMSAGIKGHIYHHLQAFVQQALREPLRKSTKKKKENIKNTLLAIWTLCADYHPDYDPRKDQLMLGQVKKKDEQSIPITNKCIPPSYTQLYMLRAMLESLVDKGEKNRTKKTMRKDLDSAVVASMENFLSDSFFWNYLINFNGTLQLCCDLSQFWYREFFLEVTKERIQFPIEMSMPWILTNHILDSDDPSMIQYLLYPMDLYNDSANYAIKHFKRRFLYDEIEAEVNLCFDQFVFKLSERIFKYYKKVAGSIMLDKKIKAVCKKNNFKLYTPKRAKYDAILKQSRVQILGRSVDLKRMLSQRINESFLKAINYAISIFEAGDLTGVLALEGALQVNRLAHRMLSKYLPLDTHESLLAEANHSVAAPIGRITLYIFLEINFDFVPNFCFNAATERFVRTVLPFADPVQRSHAPSVPAHYLWGTRNLTLCYNSIYSLYSNFIGEPHLGAMIRLMGYQDVAIVIKEMLEVIKNSISGTILPYLRQLNKVMPKRLKLPRFEYTSAGVFEYFQAQLEDIMRYSELKPKVLQSLREVGNCTIFCMLLEQALSKKEVVELAQASMFQGIIPRPFVPKKADKSREEREAELKKEMKKLEDRYKNFNLSKVIEKLGTQDQKVACKDHQLLSREKLCCGLSMFVMVLERIKPFLEDELFKGTHSQINKIWDVSENNEFHRMWSALQFVICIPPRSEHEYTVEQLFGEGLQFAGCLLIKLLNQWSRFESMDFCYHLLKVHRVDQLDKDCKGVNLRKMIDRIRKFQILNNQLFSSISKYMNAGKDLSKVDMSLITQFDPPEPEGPFPDKFPAVELRGDDRAPSHTHDDRKESVFSMYSDFGDEDDLDESQDQMGDDDVLQETRPAASRKSVIYGSTVEGSEV